MILFIELPSIFNKEIVKIYKKEPFDTVLFI